MTAPIAVTTSQDVMDKLFMEIFDVLFNGANWEGKCLFSFLLVADTAGVQCDGICVEGAYLLTSIIFTINIFC